MVALPGRKLLITLAAPVAGLAALELGLRAFGFAFDSPEVPVILWNDGHDLSLRSGTGLHVPHAECLWSPRPGAQVPLGSREPESGRVCTVETLNADGYRGPRLGAKSPRTRIALLGESALFGIGLPYADTCGAQLQELLGDEVEVMSAAVIGYTVHQGLARYRALVRALEPDVVVVAFGFLNESNPAPGASDADRMARSRHRAGLPARIAAWLSAHSRVAQLADYWRIERAGGVEAVTEHIRRAEADRARLARTRLREIRDAYGSPDWSGTRRCAPDDYERCLDRLLEEIQRDGARPIVVQLPCHPDGLAARPVLERYREINADVARRAQVPFVDLPGRLAEHRKNGLPRVETLLRGGDFWHLDGDGNRVLASAIRDCVLEPVASAPSSSTSGL